MYTVSLERAVLSVPPEYKLYSFSVRRDVLVSSASKVIYIHIHIHIYIYGIHFELRFFDSI